MAIHESPRVARFLGRHSNIPECCIDFYISKDLPSLRRINRRRGNWQDKKIQYVMCTKCLLAYKRGKLVPNKLHLCDRKPDEFCRAWSSRGFESIKRIAETSDLPPAVSPHYLHDVKPQPEQPDVPAP